MAGAAVLHCGIRLTSIKSRRALQEQDERQASPRFAQAVNITGIVVSPRPGRVDEVRDALAAMRGVEVHAVSPEGRMVVTVEQPDDHAATAALDAIAKVDGVLATALVYHHDEAPDEPNDHR